MSKVVPQRVEEMARTVIRFADSLAAGETGEFTYRIRKPCTIEGLHIRFFSGPELSVHLDPYLLKVKESRYNIVDYPADTKQYIDGDNDVIDYKVSIPCDVDDEIKVGFVNTDLANGYDIVVAFELDFMGGALRVGGAI